MSHGWWNTITDRVYLKDVYEDIGRYLQDKDTPRVLDVGVEYYNSVCKELINNNSVEFWQMDPNKISDSNDGFFNCKMQECIEKYPGSHSMFDVILDIGVLGWNGIRFSQIEQEEYINNILSLLKQGGVYILHSDRVEQEDEYKINFNKLIYPNFDKIDFMNRSTTHIIQCPINGTIWDINFLRKKVQK